MHLTENTVPKECIFILGMHRSGTSATTGCMEIVGFNLGKHFFQPAEDNEKGYFENKKINYFNTELLALLHARWHDTYHLPDNWWNDKALQSEQQKLVQIFSEEFAESTILSIKDPRISVLLPLYLPVLTQLNVIPKFIINFRNPFEVAASLEKRNNFSLSKSFLLWMDHTLKAELFSRNYDRVFLDYNSLVKNPVEAMQQINSLLKLGLKINASKTKQLNSFVEKRLKHHSLTTTQKNQDIPKMFLQLYRFLRKLNLKDPDQKLQDHFDNYRNSFSSSINFFSGIDNQQKLKIKTVHANDPSALTELLIRQGKTDVEFKPNIAKEISEFWIYPVNNYAAILIKNLKVKNENGQTLKCKQYECPADWVTDKGWMIFESEMPLIKYKPNQPSQVGSITFHIEVVSFSDYTQRISVRELISQQFEFQKSLKTSKSEIRKLKSKHNKEVKEFETKAQMLIDSHIDTIAKLKADYEREKEELKSVHSGNLNKLETEKSLLITSHNAKLNELDAEKRQLLTSQQEKMNLLRQDHKERLKHLKSEKDQLIYNHKKHIQKLEKESQQIISRKDDAIYKIEVENNKLTTELNQKVELLDVIFNSGSWKIGRTITQPIRFIKEKTQK